jgi:tRNA(Ile)-lysidine synthase
VNHEEFINKIFTSEDALSIKGRRVLVALSGGADSVALLCALLEAGYDCRAVHCNFHLRGEESMRDERFVRALCQRLDVPLTVRDFDVAAYQNEHGGSIEMACRELRYSWFEQERVEQKCALIAVAHHADDQVETFFLNLLRGTGTRGLAGMERLSGYIWRPFLGISRTDILDYLKSIGQDYVTDSTNDENDYRRNRLRNIVLPIIEQHFSNGRERILDTMNNLASDRDLLADLAVQVLPDGRHISIETLLSMPDATTLLYHRIRDLGFNRDQCHQAVSAARHEHSGRQFTGSGYVMHINRQTIDIDAEGDDCDVEIPIDLTHDVTMPVNIAVSRNNAPFSPLMCDGKQKVAFNNNVLQCKRIVLRHWRQGDRFKPFGLKGSKLVSDLFVDLKLDYAAKRDTWLLEADGEILWVLGHRAASLYPVTPESQDYLLLQL